MPKPVAKIVGIVVLIAGVGTAILHYVMEGNIFNSWLTFAIAAVLLAGGWALFDYGRDKPKQGPGQF
jgi:hypothetical protein